jgi:ribosomal protein S18 acetylase RimI-like enzyme
MKIRKAHKEDLDNVVKLGFALLKHHSKFNTYYIPIRDKNKLREITSKYFLKLMRSRNALFLVAEDDGRIVGHAIGEIKKNPPGLLEEKHGEVGEIFIKKEYRRTGLGKQFIDKILAWLKKKKIKRVVVDFDSKNRIARSAYKKMGFSPFKEIYQMNL